MGGPRSAQRAAGDGPGDGEAALILLAGPASQVERALVTRWLGEGDLQPSAVFPLDSPGLARSLATTAPDTVVTAARVAWLPRERGGERRVRGSDIVSQVNPRRPPAFWQNRIAHREPDRARLVVAEPATVAALRERWGGTGSFAQFVSRQARLALHRSERALTGYRYKVPKHVAEAIEDSPEFRASAAQLAGRLGLTEAETMARAHADLDGLVASMSPVAVDLLTGALRPLHAHAWDVQTDAAGLDRLRELNRRHALVFLPSHRSYADPLLLADVLAEHDFPRNHVLGGDNLRFWPIGPLARRAGIVFIRRSASTSAICWPSASTSSGTWRAAARAPESCARLAMGCWPTSPRRSPGAGPRTPTWCRWRLPTTSSARCRQWPPSRAGRQRRAKACPGWRPTPRDSSPGSARSTCGSRSRFRCARRWIPAATSTARTPSGSHCRRWRSRSPSGSTGSPR